MDDLTVVRVTAPDNRAIPAIAALEAEVFGEGGLNEWFLPVIARCGRLYAAKAGGRVVGAASVIRDWGGSKAFLLDLAVEGGWRRRGVARAMLSKIIDESRRERLAGVELTVDPKNHAAINLYLNLGFIVTGHRPHEYGQDNHRDVMTFEIAQ